MQKKSILYILTFFLFNLSVLTSYTQKTLTLKKTKDFSNGTADERTFSYLRDLFDTPIFFETGTYNGLSAVKFANIFPQLYTVELSDFLYEEANDRLRNYSNVCNCKDDSATYLQKMIPAVTGKKFIFLDAHGCGGRSAPDNPILRELMVLKELGASDCIIMIDDTRSFSFSGTFSLKSIYKLLKEINPNFTIASYSDAIIAYDNENIILSDIVRACTTSLFFDPKQDDLRTVFEAEKIIAQAIGEEQKALLRLTFPESALYHVWRGLIHMENQQYDEAEKLFLYAIQKESNLVRVHDYLKSVRNKQSFFPSGKDIINFHVNNRASGNATYLLCYPKSGSSFIAYLAERLTHRPNIPFWHPNKKVLDNVFLPYCYWIDGLKTDVYKKPVWKLHESNLIKNGPSYSPEKTRVIFLLRNYKEHIFREAPLPPFIREPLFNADETINENALMKTLSRSSSNGLYFRNIQFFDQLPDENKLLIYYEDFINNPEQELHRLVEFLQEGSQELEQLMAHYDDCAETFKKHYNANWGKREGGGSVSGGFDIKYHSKQYTFEQCKKIDEWVQEKHPLLWEKYLNRYEE